jgi:hypothetical protein
MVEMPVYSRSKKTVLPINVPEELTFTVSYGFTPDAGDVLLSSPAYRNYYAYCGGYNHWVRHAKSYSPDKTSAPLWQKDGTDAVLDFEAGNYLFLPGEAFSRAAFSLKMSFQVKNIKDQSLLNIAGESLQIKIKNASLTGFFLTSEGNFPWTTKPVIEANKWHDLSIIYDLNSLNLILDGKSIGNFPVKGVFLRGSLILLGNYSSDSDKHPFTGRLRALSISNLPR